MLGKGLFLVTSWALIMNDVRLHQVWVKTVEADGSQGCWKSDSVSAPTAIQPAHPSIPNKTQLSWLFQGTEVGSLYVRKAHFYLWLYLETLHVFVKLFS